MTTTLNADKPGRMERFADSAELRCLMVDDPHLRRTMRVAKLTRTEDARRPELIPSLYDADVITLGRTGAVIIGIERLPAERGVVEFAQSWWIRFV